MIPDTSWDDTFVDLCKRTNLRAAVIWYMQNLVYEMTNYTHISFDHDLGNMVLIESIAVGDI